MKKVFLLSCLLPLTVALASISLLSRQAIAVSGYCMTRSSYDGEWQRQDSWNFNKCEQENNQIDGDNIFDPLGLVYWDSGS